MYARSARECCGISVRYRLSTLGMLRSSSGILSWRFLLSKTGTAQNTNVKTRKYLKLMRPLPVSEARMDGLRAPEDKGICLDKAGLAGAKILRLDAFMLEEELALFLSTSVIIYKHQSDVQHIYKNHSPDLPAITVVKLKAFWTIGKCNKFDTVRAESSGTYGSLKARPSTATKRSSSTEARTASICLTTHGAFGSAPKVRPCSRLSFMTRATEKQNRGSDP